MLASHVRAAAQCLFELGTFDLAADELTCAYMAAGADIFEDALQTQPAPERFKTQVVQTGADRCELASIPVA